MYIKEIGIKGFRTYRDLSVFRFSPGYNVIVGLNGSGKSNVLLAVTFALAETLEHANRSCYLYRGDEESLEEDFSAHVEVIFDISSDPSAQSLVEIQEELRLKRIFSRTKDVYLVNGRQMSRKDYRQFIESLNLIHFSKQSSSYCNDLSFIVKQGAVGKICNMTAEDRITAFRDIIGHRAFDSKIEDSAKILQDYQVMAKSLDAQISQISRKIDSMDIQRGEGQEWAALDTERRVLQAKLLMLKIAQLKEEISHHEKQELKQAEAVNSLQSRIDILEMDISELRGSLSIVESMNELNAKKSELDALETSMAEVDSESSELHKEIGLLSHDKEELDREIGSLTTSIDSASRDLNIAESECITVTRRIQELETQLNEVMHKQQAPGEKTLEMISRLEQNIEHMQGALKQEEANQATLVKSLDRCLQDQEVVRNEQSKYAEMSTEKNAAYQESTSQLEKCTEKRRVKQKELATLLIKQSNLRLQHSEGEKNFNKVALSQKQTLSVVEEWLKAPESEKHRDNYIGILLGIVTVSDTFKIAVEQALGSKLFTVVLRTMSSAKALVQYIENSGKKYNNIRIVALELLPPRDKATLGNIDRNVSLPLMECLKFPEEVKPLIHSLIGEYCLVESVEVASRLTKERFNCVTLDGQLFHHRGSVSGGYVNVQESVLKLYDAMKRIEDDMKNTEKGIEDLGNDLKLIDAKQEELSKKRQAAKAERLATLEKVNQLQISLQQLTSLEESIRHRMGDSKKERLLHQIRVWTNQIEVFKQSQSPSKSDVAELTKRQEELKEDLASQRLKKSTLDAKMHEISDHLAVLREKRNAASKRMITVMQMFEDYSGHLRELQGKSESLRQSHDSLSAEYMNISKDSERLQHQRDEICSRLHKMESQLTAYRSEVSEANSRNRVMLQAMSAMRLSIKEAEEELSRTERNIVSKAEEYPTDSRDQIMSKLAEINKKCAVYDLSSRICTQDCSSLRAEYSELKERYDRITRSYAAIVKSVKALRSQKDANLVHMLNQLNDKLSLTFEELVPNGRIRAVLIKREGTSRDPSANVAICLPECFSESPDDEIFTGLEIKVAFGSASEAMQPLYQLSGGQKTLVSLAFILAAQRLQTSPFYLLDEIDAALDDNYRSNVAKLLQKQCEAGSQCILTTFRPELLGPGETFYEIRNEGGVSVMRSIGIDDALSVINRTSVAITNGPEYD